jgi:hypothetical protein
MRRLPITLVACFVVGVLVLSPSAPAWAQGYDVYKNSQDGTAIPDVDKTPPPPANLDMSCWLGVASNVLAGAGWGQAGNTAQQNAAAIYGHLTNHFTKLQTGSSELAIDWWLINYGLNFNAPDVNYYNPVGSYTDVTHLFVGGGLTAGDYNFLLNELTRCQYVAVSVDTFTEVGHEMTLVGGNKANLQAVPPPPVTTVWHDTDDGLAGDDPMQSVFLNDGHGTWYVRYPGIGGNGWLAQDYTTLCPGLHKPKAAIENYDAAWYKDINNGSWETTFHTAGEMKDSYAKPAWDPQDPNHKVIIGNLALTENYKEIWLLVDYNDRVANRGQGEQILLFDNDLNLQWAPTTITDSNDGGQTLYYWKLDRQPTSESILFPNDAYYTLNGYVMDWDVSTLCVPEPCVLALLVLGGAIALCRRRVR